VKAQRCQRTPYQAMRPDCGLVTLMAAARRNVEAELRADVQAQFRLVANAYKPHLASLKNGEPAGRCYSQRPASGRATFQPWANLPLPATKLARDGERAAHWVSILPGIPGLAQNDRSKMANPGTQSE
jgi:hypothetical protein